MLRSFKELEIWRRSLRLCKTIYQFTSGLPSDEKYGLVSQMRRAAVSAPSNIAEGHSRGTTKDYIRFLWMANGTLAEWETQLLLLAELGQKGEAECSPIVDEVNEIGRMIRAMIRSLRKNESK